MQGDIEPIILENLIHNEDYFRKVLPFLKGEYFQDNPTKLVFNTINDYSGKYNNLPTQSELIVEIKNKTGISQNDFEQSVDIVNELTKQSETPSLDWLITQTENFCKERALYNSLLNAAERMEFIQQTGEFNFGDVPDDIRNALAITFDASVGLEYSEMEGRWERRKQRKVEKVRFCVEAFNQATNGGMNLKTITCVAAGTGAGKSAIMCAQAAYSLLNGDDVLYITLEMDEDAISDRIDANILGIDLDDIEKLSKDDYVKRLRTKLDGKKIGRLFVKEYPTACAGVLEFRALLQELNLKQNFKPRLIVVDYLNICSSSRFRGGSSNVNSYTLVKAIAEELRGMAKESNAAILTGTQLNRDGVDNTNVSLKEISESSGLSHTVDMLFAMMRTEELDKQNQVMIKQLKNRFGDMVKMLKFCIGVDRSKFRYFDVDIQNLPPDEDGVLSSTNTDSIDDLKIEWNGNFGAKKKPSRNFSGLSA